MRNKSLDVVVIGSGFGGAITACRLAERNYKVLILERGRRWIAPKYHAKYPDRTPYPRNFGDPWIWSNTSPAQLNGWADFRIYPGMTVVQGAGVGGGSLIYANVSVEASRGVFTTGWPKELTYNELKPYYKAVANSMAVQRIPSKQWNPRTHLMKEAATKAGYPGKFRALEL